MRWWRWIGGTIRSLFRKAELDRELDAELRSYLDLLTEEKIKAGLTPDQARRQARIELGGIEQVKMKVREARFGTTLETVWQDIRYGLRMLRKNPGFTAVAVLTLTLGIGANTAIFSVLHAVLLRPLPVEDQERVVQILDQLKNFPNAPISHPNFHDYRDQNQVFDKIGVLARPALLPEGEEDSRRISGMHIGADLFSVLGVRLQLGRPFAREEDNAGAPPTIILSHAFWQERFGGDPEVVGKSLPLKMFLSGHRRDEPRDWHTVNFTVVGVLSPDFQLPPIQRRDTLQLYSPQVLVPQGRRTWGWGNRGMYGLTVLAHLKPGVTIEQARANLNAIAATIARDYPETNKGYSVTLTPLPDLLRQRYGTILYVLMGTVGFILLIACVNVANLLLSRAAIREREFAVRAALGAGRSRLFRQFFTESALLAAGGAVSGILLAAWGVQRLVSLLPGDVPRLNTAALDARVLGFTLVVSVATVLLFGLLPAWQCSRPDLNRALKDGGRGSGGGRHNLLKVLVVSEVALALVLLMGAGLLINSFIRLTSINPGFDRENVLTLRLDLLPPPLSKYPSGPPMAHASFFQRLLEELRSLPGVVSVAGIDGPPLNLGENTLDISIPGRPLPPREEKIAVDWRSASPGYFQTMGIPLLKGRAFTEQDRYESPQVILINQTMAKRYWPNDDPIGKGFYWGHQDVEAMQKGTASYDNGGYDERYPLPRLWTIVGVVGEVKTLGLEQEPRNQVYYPILQFIWRSLTVVIRTRSNPLALVGAVRDRIRSVDKTEPLVSHVQTMDQYFSRAVAQPRFRTLLLGFFAGLALVLALVGLYGVLAYSVSQRTHEIGIRMALGAQPSDILRMIMGQGLGLVLVGVGAGLMGAFALTRFLESLLFGVTPTDPATFAGVSLLLAAVALLACYIPARRATRVDPMVALRYE
jgi:putative ABC transport system permease protein